MMIRKAFWTALPAAAALALAATLTGCNKEEEKPPIPTNVKPPSAVNPPSAHPGPGSTVAPAGTHTTPPMDMGTPTGTATTQPADEMKPETPAPTTPPPTEGTGSGM